MLRAKAKIPQQGAEHGVHTRKGVTRSGRKCLTCTHRSMFAQHTSPCDGAAISQQSHIHRGQADGMRLSGNVHTRDGHHLQTVGGDNQHECQRGHAGVHTRVAIFNGVMCGACITATAQPAVPQGVADAHDWNFALLQELCFSVRNLLLASTSRRGGSVRVNKCMRARQSTCTVRLRERATCFSGVGPRTA